MKSIFISCVLVSLFQLNLIQAQNTNQVGFINYTHPERLYRGKSGHPYLFPHWETGEMVWNKKLLKGVALKYDIHQDQLLFMRAIDNDSILLDMRAVGEFIFHSQQNRKFVAHEHKRKIKFFEVIQEGEVTLLKKWKKVFIQADKDITYSNNKFYDEYRLKSFLFLQKDDQLVKLNHKNDLLNLITPSKVKAVTKFIKQNQLFLKEEKDILLALKYYEGL